METESIKKIRSLVAEAEQELARFKPKDIAGQSFGSEKEYTPTFLKAELKALFGVIRRLTKAHFVFIQISTNQERGDISNTLSNLTSCLTQKDYPNVAIYMDNLKTILRPYRTRESSESQAELLNRTNELHTTLSGLEEKVSLSESILSNAHDIKEHHENLISKLNELGEKSPQIESLLDLSVSQQQKIYELLESAKSHEKDLKNFIEQIEVRNSQFTEQKQRTEEYVAKLEEYTAEHNQAKKQATDLLGEAKSALEFSTIAGISSAFNERYIEEKKRRRVNSGWLVGASAFIVGAMGIGIFFLFSKDQISLGDSIVRIAIMSTAIGAAWFCATRYARYNNIMEDYGYKSVLAKTILAFHDYFEGDNREGYMQSFMKEMLQDPLRKRHDVEHPAASILQRITRSKKDNEGDQ